MFGTLKRVILDELHSLVTSKRGDLLSLGLARLFTLAPQLTTDRPFRDGCRARRALPFFGCRSRCMAKRALIW